jgi:hypothetical protein
MLQARASATLCYKARLQRPRGAPYNAGMNKSALTFLLLMLTALPYAGAQDVPPAPPSSYGQRQMRPHDFSPEQREQWREERRQRREALQQMSPEERHQLRRDVREAGQSLYPRGPRRRAD